MFVCSIWHEDTGVTFRREYDENLPISFSCDGDCEQDNITIHVKAVPHNADRWADDFYLPRYLGISTARDRLNLKRDLCECKESIKPKGSDPWDDWETKCRVWECFFKNNSLGESWVTEARPNFSFADQLLRLDDSFESLIQSGFPVSVYLQGSKTVFRGGMCYFHSLNYIFLSYKIFW